MISENGEGQMLKNFFRTILYRIRGEYTTERLIKMGLKVGTNFARLHGVILDPAHCWLIEIGNNVTLAPRVHVLAHDASTKFYLDYAKIGRVRIGNNVFIGAESVILPNVEIGDNVIVGANSTVTHSLEGGFVYVGNPVRRISSIEAFVDKNRNLMDVSPCYSEEYTIRANIDDTKKRRMLNDMKGVYGFVK